MPWIARYFYFIASILLTCIALVASKTVISPLIAAFILALALQPLAKRLEQLRIPRLLSSLLSVSMLLLIILGTIFFFTVQVGKMDFELDAIKTTYDGISGKMHHLITDTLNISLEAQASLFKEVYTSGLKNSASFVNRTLSFTTNFLSSLVFFAITLFFILYYRSFFRTFLLKAIPNKHHLVLNKVLKNILLVVKHYVFGVALIMLIVAILNSIGLSLLGIKNAVVFGVMASILTLIPYIGILIASLLPMFFAFFTKASLWYPLGVLGVFMFVQFLEGNFLTPNIVGKQVSINPFAAVLGLILGGSLLGLVGIFFALPLLAIFKVICDRVSSLKPLGYLIGNAPH